MADGSIIIDTRIDTGGVSKGMNAVMVQKLGEYGVSAEKATQILAVLGDQKQGNNIETPEALLRKIVREETAGRQAGGGSYRFTAQINRRTLFDEMMKEAQMRRDTSGRNPFEMA